MLSLSRRKLMLVAGASLLPGAVALPQRDTSRQDGEDGTRLKRVFANLSDDAERLVSDDQVTGISIGGSDGHNRKAAYFGYADTDCKTPVDELTQFRIASIIKPLTATTVLKLKEMGLLSLDQTIERYFPDFPRANEITIYHLLTHTSGILNWWGLLPFNTPDEFMSDREAQKWLARMDTTSLFDPGTQRDYSNSGYLLLGAIIENVTGQSYQEALQRLVLSKAGAILTELESPCRPKPRWAKGYIMFSI